uniref:Sugar phosphate transporter domain-containing protein n=1 Tax=Spongospora subterranea TaxID=70186 RepID=A0A0H5QFR8_9EUKA|eukprot:CRZ00898.1 hypothetical protein [Spongospora subterranea]
MGQQRQGYEQHRSNGARLFIASSVVVFASYSVYSLLLEFILNGIPGYSFTTFLTLFQFASGALLLHLHRLCAKRESSAPIRAYLLLAVLSTSSFILSNLSCIYLTYPTQVLLKNGKLLPVMGVGRLWLNKRFPVLEYVSVVILTIGMIIFSLGNSLSPTALDRTGLILISGAVISDAFIGNAQELILRTYLSSKLELMYYTKGLGTLFILIVCILSGELYHGLYFCSQNLSVLLYLSAFSLSGLVGELSVLALIEKFGVIEAVTVTSLRKMFTIILSFILFPKPIVPAHYIGTIAVFSGIALNVYVKNVSQIDRALFSILGRHRGKVKYLIVDNSSFV